MNLQANQTNSNVPLSLEDSTTLSPAVYLFEWQNEQTKVKYYAICQDVSTVGAQRDRSNLFDITEGTNDPLNSKVILGNDGRYIVTVWEQLSTTNLNPTLADVQEPIYRGLCNLYGTETSQYNAHEQTITYQAHEPAL